MRPISHTIAAAVMAKILRIGVPWVQPMKKSATAKKHQNRDDCRQPIENAARSELRIARSPSQIVVIGPSHRYFPLTREQVSIIARSSPRFDRAAKCN